jgi:predicted phosphodiesterase
MRVAALYDVHGNLPALEAVLADVEASGADEIVVGGDVLFGPLQAGCVARLRKAGATFLAGNCEREILGSADDPDHWCLDRLDDETRAFVGTWAATAEREVHGLGRVVFCHATPRRDDEILTARTPDAAIREALRDVDADVVVAGHTHVQFDRTLEGAPRFVNAGSVGLPYQGEAGAFWALLGPGVELRRSPYDVERAIDQLAGTGFPRFEIVYPESLRGEVSAESATEHFESLRGA